MTIKAILYFDKFHAEYNEIINSIKKVKLLEIISFVCSMNTPLVIEGLHQFTGSLYNCIQQTKVSTIIIFTLTQDVLEDIVKVSSSQNPVTLILFPLNISINTLEKMLDYSSITLYTCLPIRHMVTTWQAYKKLISHSSYEPIQYIEAKLSATLLKQKNSVYGSTMEHHINLNNFYQLIFIDAIQFLSQRKITKVQAFAKSMAYEIDINTKNEKYMDDYTVIIAYFKWKECDMKKSPTALSSNCPLLPRTALIRITPPKRDDHKVDYKIKIQSNSSVFLIDKSRALTDDIDCETGDRVTAKNPKSITSEDNHESFWSSLLFCQGAERFIKHLDYMRQEGTPRLVDLGLHTDDDNSAAKTTMITASQLLGLCKVVRAVSRASHSSATVFVE